MPLIPLQLPKGLYKNGTDLMGQGRWQEANLVRWHDDVLQPIGGWRQRESVDIQATARTALAWNDNSGNRRLAFGAHSKLAAVSSSGTVYDLTPADLTAGSLDATNFIGYGASTYGSYGYGVPRPDLGNLVPATQWTIDTWGEYIVACSPNDGRLLEWDLTLTEGSDLVTNGSFATDSDWTKGAGWTIASGVATYSGTATGNTLVQTYTSTFEVGKTYQVQFTFATTTAADVKVTVDGSQELATQTFDTAGTLTLDFTADSTGGTLTFELGTSTGDTETFTIDDVSIKLQPKAYVVDNAPVDNDAIFVTEERFVVCLGAGGNPRKVQWSDQEDNTTWTAAATNQAGDLELQTNGKIMLGIRTRGQGLILTTEDAHSMTYQGPPFVYGLERVGTSCGAVSRQCAATVDNGVIWMGENSFFIYSGGAVQSIPCEVGDYVFTDINRQQISKVSAVSNSAFNEIWWFYPSGSSTECDRYVAYNYRDNFWMVGEMDRTCGADAGVFLYPMFAKSNGEIYEHEIGTDYDTDTPFAETGPILIGAGDQAMRVTNLIPDEKTQGDVTAKFKTRFYPNGEEREYGPFSMSNPTSVRFQGRQVRMRVEGNQPADWRVGIMRLQANAGGTR